MRSASSPRKSKSSPGPLLGLLLTLLWWGACTASDANGTTNGDGDLEVATTATAELTAPDETRTRRRPPSPSEGELEALAASQQVVSLNNPFAESPPPNRLLHVPMSDGTKLAVALYFPMGVDETKGQAATVYIESWYGTRAEAGGTAIGLYRAAGLVVAIVDPRGFGASFGSQSAFLTDDVRRDESELLSWVAAQPWSNGKVAAVGLSISASQAEAVAGSGMAAVKAAIIRSSDFDHYANNMFPGGIPNTRMHGFVTFVTSWMRGEACVQDLASCAESGIRPVDGDDDFRLLQAAFRDHQSNVRGEVLDSLVYRDDAIGTGTVANLSASDHTAELRRAAVPARVVGSWLDGTTADTALARFAALPDVPMEVSIGAVVHSGGLDADPFSRKPFQAAQPGALQQYGDDVAFVQKALAGQATGRSVTYRVLGTDTWKTTGVWPPTGVTIETLRLSRTELVTAAKIAAGERRYEVDPAASTGNFNRWASQGGHAVFTGDRAEAPGRRLTFDGAPVGRDLELVGAPEVCLALRTDQPDGTVIAYLEDVAPDGRVTYLTEGELRLLHRKTHGSELTTGCDPAPGTKRTFNRADGEAVTPGALMRVELPLLQTAARIQKGHHLRLAFAGADAGNFSMLTDSPATWRVSYGGNSGSTLRIPVRPWSPR